MKKLTAIVLTALIMAGCTTKEPTAGERGVEFLTDMIEKVKTVSSAEDLMCLLDDNSFDQQMESIMADLEAERAKGDSVAYADEMQKIQSLLEELDQLISTKYSDLMSIDTDFTPDYDDRLYDNIPLNDPNDPRFLSSEGPK